MARAKLVALTQVELTLICDALYGYSAWLERALSELHRDLKQSNKLRRHNQRINAQELRGKLYQRFEAAAHAHTEPGKAQEP